jgi:hypothetical protein
MASQSFASPAWLLKGITVSIPGWLELKRDRLRFMTPEEVVFDAPLSEVTSVTFPWYYFGGGVKLLASGQPHRLSFVVPNGGEYVEGRALAAFGNPESLFMAASKMADIHDGREIGRRWRELLGGAATASSPT